MASFSVTRRIRVPACTGTGLEVKAGDLIRITDFAGHQPCDFWAFNHDNIYEHLSCEHTKPSIEKLFPRTGDCAYTNQRRPIVLLVEDNSPGQHDMQFAACDKTRYLELGADEDHPSCQANLHTALKELGLFLPYSPQPWNLFTNFSLNPNGTFTIKSPDTNPGDNVVLRAEMDAYIVVSACPQDMNATCGGSPSDIELETGH